MKLTLIKCQKCRLVDENLSVVLMKEVIYTCFRVENTVGKIENAGYNHFLFFSHNVFKRP